MTLPRPASRLVLVGAILCAMLGLLGASLAAAAPEGTLIIAMHFSPVTRSLERGTFMTSWREKKHKGVVLTSSGVSGNAAPRLESFVTKNGAFAYGALPEVVHHLGFLIGVGPRVDDIMATAIPGLYMSPYEDLKLRAR
jgi:hypothetical protein